jgi:hypothetical protein
MFWSRLSVDARKFALMIPLFAENSTPISLYIATRADLLTAMVRIPCYNDGGPDLLTVQRGVYIRSGKCYSPSNEPEWHVSNIACCNGVRPKLE